MKQPFCDSEHWFCTYNWQVIWPYFKMSQVASPECIKFRELTQGCKAQWSRAVLSRPAATSHTADRSQPDLGFDSTSAARQCYLSYQSLSFLLCKIGIIIKLTIYSLFLWWIPVIMHIKCLIEWRHIPHQEQRDQVTGLMWSIRLGADDSKPMQFCNQSTIKSNDHW